MVVEVGDAVHGQEATAGASPTTTAMLRASVGSSTAWARPTISFLDSWELTAVLTARVCYNRRQLAISE